jgi:5'-3' exoribonuclease 1
MNIDFLKIFLKYLSNIEDEFFTNKLHRFLKKSKSRRCFETEPHKKEIWRIENLVDLKIYDSIMLGYDNKCDWKTRYYYEYFNIDPSDVDSDLQINDICKNYLEGLFWSMYYYFDKCPAWKWQYKYTHPPFISDLSIYVDKMQNSDQINFQKDEPVNMFTQLVSVLPPQYSKILPEPFQFLSTSEKSPVIDMFPMKFNIDYLYQTQLYKCIPIIPIVDIDRIEILVKSIMIEHCCAKKYTDRIKKMKTFQIN